MTLSMSYECYAAQMELMGFAPHEIEECWASPDAFKILDAAELDGERYIGPEVSL